MTWITVATTVLPILGILVGAALQYAFGRSLEAKRRNREQRGQAYADYFRCFAAIATVGRTKDVISALADSKTRVCVYGSADVIKSLGDFERSGATSNTPESRLVVSKLLETMRKDVDPRSKAPASEDIGLILFGKDWRV